MSDSARSLHSSWFAAITLSCQSGTERSTAAGKPTFHGSDGSATPATFGDQLAEGAAVGSDSWLRARLSMPVWPFSGGCYGGEAPTEDSGGYWGVDAGTIAGAVGYSLWRIPAPESAWQGEVINCVCDQFGVGCC